MPRVAQFNGIVIAMYFADHNPPHFHALYAGDEALITIGDLQVIKGSLPTPQLKEVRRWAQQHEPLLQAKWDELHEDD